MERVFFDLEGFVFSLNSVAAEMVKLTGYPDLVQTYLIMVELKFQTWLFS